MPRAVRGIIDCTNSLLPANPTRPGVLIECDPSVKAIILKYDEERHDYIVEDLDDDRHLVIKESQLQNLKLRLGKVRDQEERCAGFLADQDCRTWTINLCSPTNRNRNNLEKTRFPLPLYPKPRPIFGRHFHSRWNHASASLVEASGVRRDDTIYGKLPSRRMRKYPSSPHHRRLSIRLGPIL